MNGHEYDYTVSELKTFMQQVYLINSSGSLMYSYSTIKNLDSNDHIALASTYFSLSIMSNECSPREPCTSGLREIGTTAGSIACLETPTGIRLIAAAAKHVPIVRLHQFLRDLYRLYADFVVKNPFFVPNQLIRAAKFEKGVQRLVQGI